MSKQTFTHSHVHLISLSEQALGESIALLREVEEEMKSKVGVVTCLHHFDRPWLNTICLTSYDLCRTMANQCLLE